MPKPYKSYRFAAQDPIVRKVLSEISGLSKAEIERKSGVCATTLRNWASGKTLRPQFSTLNATLRTVGAELTITKKS